MPIRNEAPARANATEAPNTDPIPSSNLAATAGPINRRRAPEDVLYERDHAIEFADAYSDMAKAVKKEVVG